VATDLQINISVAYREGGLQFNFQHIFPEMCGQAVVIGVGMIIKTPKTLCMQIVYVIIDFEKERTGHCEEKNYLCL
jgi:hypothetical protein